MNITWQRGVLIGVAIGVVALVIAAFAPSPVRVETDRVTEGPLRVTVDEEGEVRAHDRYVVAASVAGRLARVVLEPGDSVTENQVVARLGPLPLGSRERDEQIARVAAAQAAVREADERARHAEADHDHAKRERARFEKLLRDGFVSPQIVEEKRIAQTTSANDLQAARFKAKSSASELEMAQAGLMALRPGKNTEIMLRSPVHGQVLRINEKSERVVLAGAPVLTIGDPAKFEVVIDVLSTDAVKIKPGMPVLLEGWGRDQPIRARVRVVEPAAFTKVSALGIEEQRVNIISDFVDPPGPLGDGYRVEGRIVIWQQDKVRKLPVSSLFRSGEGWSVFVIQQGRARRHTVEVGQRNGVEAEVLRGIEPGAVVVRHPSNDLADGVRVEVQER